MDHIDHYIQRSTVDTPIACRTFSPGCTAHGSGHPYDRLFLLDATDKFDRRTPTSGQARSSATVSNLSHRYIISGSADASAAAERSRLPQCSLSETTVAGDRPLVAPANGVCDGRTDSPGNDINAFVGDSDTCERQTPSNNRRLQTYGVPKSVSRDKLSEVICKLEGCISDTITTLDSSAKLHGHMFVNTSDTWRRLPSDLCVRSIQLHSDS